MNTPDITLYEKQNCPFSAKVRRFIQKNGLTDKVEYRDIEIDESARKDLQQLTGQLQIPCLVAGGGPILDSDAIVNWLDYNLIKRRPEVA